MTSRSALCTGCTRCTNTAALCHALAPHARTRRTLGAGCRTTDSRERGDSLGPGPGRRPGPARSVSSVPPNGAVLLARARACAARPSRRSLPHRAPASHGSHGTLCATWPHSPRPGHAGAARRAARQASSPLPCRPASQRAGAGLACQPRQAGFAGARQRDGMRCGAAGAAPFIGTAARRRSHGAARQGGVPRFAAAPEPCPPCLPSLGVPPLPPFCTACPGWACPATPWPWGPRVSRRHSAGVSAPTCSPQARCSRTPPRCTTANS